MIIRIAVYWSLMGLPLVWETIIQSQTLKPPISQGESKRTAAPVSFVFGDCRLQLRRWSLA